MRRLWALASKDLLETRRDKLAGLFTIVMPLAFTLFLGLLFSGGESRYPLAVANQDRGGDAARQLIVELRKSKIVEVDVVSVAAVDRRVEDQKAVAGLIIPKGYSAAIDGAQKATLVFVRDAGSSAAQSAEQEVAAIAARQASEQRAAQAAVAAVERQFPEAGGSAGISEQARSAVSASLADPALTVTVVQSGSGASEVPSGFDLTSPGMIINFILFSISTAGIALIMERRNGTLQRLLTTRAGKSQLIGGKILGMFLLTFIQQCILILVGALVFQVDYFADPAALLLVMIGLSLLVSCVGLLLATLFGSEPALISASVMLSMAWAAMSGAWFPLEITGPTFSTIGHLLPTAWILDAFRGISLKGWGVADVLPAFGYALAWAAGFFILGVWRFRTTEK
jgi:ABC-2 type transport system permease protein